jgi:hypothetical protein
MVGRPKNKGEVVARDWNGLAGRKERNEHDWAIKKFYSFTHYSVSYLTVVPPFENTERTEQHKQTFSPMFSKARDASFGIEMRSVHKAGPNT